MKVPARSPRELAYKFWPDGFTQIDGSPRWFYDKQWEIVDSVWNNDETIVVAGNMLGKDFVAGFICLAYFLLHHGPTVRVVTTSVRDDHLRVLWGEIGRFIQSCKYPLTHDKGGPLVMNHRDIKKIVNGKVCPISYLRGMVSEKGEGMAGHHADYTLFVGDEASGLENIVNEQADGWTSKKLLFGNPNQCSNFFKEKVEEWDSKGNVPDPSKPGRFHRKGIRIRAEDSPNVRYSLAEERAGRRPSNKVLVPGVIKYEDGIKGYVYRRKHWDRVRQCVGLDARFWKGAELLLWPPDWLDRAEQLAEVLRGRQGRRAKGMGVDPGEGDADSCWSVTDDFGLMELVSMKTPDTSLITDMTYDLARRYGLEPEEICFDRGGGGKQIADMMRREGFNVRTVGFGESVMLDIRQGLLLTDERKENREERYAFKNRRAQMYGELSDAMDPGLNPQGFAIPAEYTELRRQMSIIPKTRDKEGTLYVLPKNKRDPNSKERTLTELLGCSPDELDSLVLAYYAMIHAEPVSHAGVA